MASRKILALRSTMVAAAAGGLIFVGTGAASANTYYYDALNYGTTDGNTGVLYETGHDCNWGNDKFSNGETVNNDITSLDSYDSRGDYLFDGTDEGGCTSASYAGWDLYVVPYASIPNLATYDFNNKAGGHLYG
ncbi:hypothetical protein ACWERV_18155 [Streptomyces sp. NPDC004031]